MMKRNWIVLFIASLSSIANAEILPPPDFDSWIYHAANYCSSPAQTAGLAPCGGSATGSLAVIDRAHPDHDAGTNNIGGGVVSPNKMAAYYESNRSFQRVSTAIQDIYTVSGPPGEIDLLVRLNAEAEASRVVPFGSTQPLGRVTLRAQIGTSLRSTGQLGGGFAFASDELPSGVGPLSDLLVAQAMAERTVTVGEAFSLAFVMILEGTSGARADARNTALIEFDVPDGYSLTSELGWTPVPVPPALALLATATLPLIRRRRRPAMSRG